MWRKSLTQDNDVFHELVEEYEELMADTRHATDAPGWIEAWLDRLDALYDRAHAAGYGLNDIGGESYAGLRAEQRAENPPT